MVGFSYIEQELSGTVYIPGERSAFVRYERVCVCVGGYHRSAFVRIERVCVCVCVGGGGVTMHTSCTLVRHSKV